MSRHWTFALVTVCIATLAAGLVDARWSHRWGQNTDLSAAGERLAAVPESVGDWQMRSSQPLGEETAEMLQCSGSFSRVYSHRHTGEAVSVALIVGPPGPTAVHTPEICYSSRGHTITESPQSQSTSRASVPEETVWRMTFRGNDAEQRLLRVLYAWRGPHEAHWRASDDPRYEYATEPLLYKIQVASQLSDWNQSDNSDPCQKFLADFLPTLDVLFVPDGP